MSRGIQHKHIIAATTDTVGGTTIGTTETAFAKTCLVEASSLNKGDWFIGFYAVKATATNTTNTLSTKVYVGPTSSPKTGILVCDQTAIDVADNDVIGGYFLFSIDSLGAASVLSVSALGVSFANALTAISKTLAVTAATDAQVSSLADLCVAVTATWSASSAANSCYLSALHVAKFPGLPSQ